MQAKKCPWTYGKKKEVAILPLEAKYVFPLFGLELDLGLGLGLGLGVEFGLELGFGLELVLGLF